MFRPHSFGEAHAWGNKEFASRVDVGLQKVVEIVSPHITPRDEVEVFVQMLKDFWMLVGNVAPHHHALAVGAQHPVDAVDVLVIDRLLPKGIDVCFGLSLTEAFRFVTVDVEIGRLIGSCHFAEVVFEELVGLIRGGVEVPFRVGEVAVEGVAQNFLKVPKTLLVADDLDMIGSAKVLQLLDFLSSKSISGGDVGMTFRLEGVFGVERERIELAFGHLRDEAFQIVHADDRPAADVVLPGANLEVGPIGDSHAGQLDAAAVTGQEGITVELFQALHAVEKPCVGSGLQADMVSAYGQFVGLVLVFTHAEVVGLDEFNVMLAFDGTA